MAGCGEMSSSRTASVAALLMFTLAGVADAAQAHSFPDQMYSCVSANATSHRRGKLTAQYEGKKLTGWTCTLDSYSVCSAGKNGRWLKCTFPPPGWPKPVPRRFLLHPPAPPPSEGNAAHPKY